MTAWRAAALGWLVVIVVLAALATQAAHAGPVVKAPSQVYKSGLPQGDCDPEHQWDIEIIDGVFYECDCYHMPFGPPLCSWYEIESHAEDPTRFRKLVRAAKLKRQHIVVRTTVRIKAVVR